MAVIIESFATAHNGGNNQTTLTISKPAGTVEGDLLICFLFSRRDVGTVNNHSTLSGWTLIQTAQADPASVLMVTSSFYKVATDSEPDNYTWTQSESQRFCGIIMRVTGLDTTNPVDVFDAATYQETPGNNLIPAPSVTPTVTNGWLVCGVGFPWAGVTFTASPPGMTEVYNFNAEQNALNAAVAVEQLTTADPTGRRDWTATDYWSIGQSIVFRTAGGTPATVVLTGTRLDVAATFPTGAITSVRALTGNLLEVGVTFPGGVVNADDAILAGNLLAVGVTFPQGEVTQVQDLTGALLVVSPVFPGGVVSSGAATISGTLLAVGVGFPGGRVYRTVDHPAGLATAEVDAIPPAEVAPDILVGTAEYA